MRAMVALFFLIAAGLSHAHHDPATVIADITAQIAKDGASAELLYRRAVEYQTLRKNDLAAKDLEAAVAKDPKFSNGYRALGNVYAEEGKFDRAFTAIAEATKLAETDLDHASCCIARAGIEEAQGKLEAALASCEKAFALHERGQIDWFIRRAELLQALGRDAESVGGLRTGYETSRSAVLRIAWIEALIATGDFASALAPIEKSLAQTRFRSSWLLRRAQVYQGLKKTSEAEAEADVTEAIAEIEERLHPTKPDPTLIADRGLGYALLGKTEKAKKALAGARKLGAPKWSTRRLEAVLASREDAAIQ